MSQAVAWMRQPCGTSASANGERQARSSASSAARMAGYVCSLLGLPLFSTRHT